MIQRIRATGAACEILPFPTQVRELGESSSTGRSSAAQILRVLVRSAAFARYVLRVRNTLRRVDPDIIHSNGIKMHVVAALARPRRRTAVVWHLHDYMSPRRLSARLLRMLSPRCDLAIANSRSVEADARAVFPKLPVETIYNSVDLERFTPEGERADLDLLAGLAPAPPGTLRVGLVATFARWKGHEVFLRAAARVRSEVPIRFYIIGGPVYATAGSQWSMDELQSLAADLGVTNRVAFTRFIPAVEKALRSLDVVVHASDRPEPFGLVILQAMACGVAVVSTATGGASELIARDLDALVVPGADSAALAAAIERLATDPGLRSEIASAGRASVAARFAPGQMIERLVQVYTRSKAQ